MSIMVKEPIKLSSCKHGVGHYSLDLELKDAHTAHSSHSYAPEVGMRVCFTVYGLTPHQIINLGNDILQMGFKLNREWDKDKDKAEAKEQDKSDGEHK